jgi:Retrotransposon gag protein
MMQQQNQRMETLEQQLREQRSGGTSTPEVTPAVTITEDAVREPLAVRTKKNKLPELSEFSGKRAEFRPWLTQAKAKLAVDKLEETEIVRFWYVHSRLRGDALSQTSSWVDSVESTEHMTVDGLVSQLRAAYDDNDTAERASRKLSQMRQGPKSFGTFLAEFDRTLLDAGGLGWADQVKKTFLSNCLSYDLQNAIVATPIPSTYREYCRLLHTVSTNLEALQRKKNKIVDTGMSYAAEPLPTGDIMDWEPATTVAAAARTQRARWVPQDVLDQRRKMGQCLRCGVKDHFVRQCALLPAARPRQEEKVLVAASEEHNKPGKE